MRARLVLAAVLALPALSAEAADPDATGLRWITRVETSKMDDKAVFTAILLASNTFSVSYRRNVRAALGIRCVDGRATLSLLPDVVLDSGRYGLVSTRMRFDGEQAQDVGGDVSDTRRSVVLYRPAELIPRIASASTLLVEFPAFQSGRPVVEFSPSSLQQHASELKTHCGISLPEPQ